MVVLKDHKPQIGAGRGPQKIDFEKFEKINAKIYPPFIQRFA